ncbi:quaternary amine ABC transporter ATP-binding protein [Mariniplasma anaerobium]|uniref:ABC-type quaternary amine transporter n=1 Tax=Mariniplasma anaerobium TaxID=2735436 RepID=A0A7U9TJC9_9MOLU|nr:betaine/proline/choline family ABC transporter ATP-binding protein [Mariniplasma anaerobium]BCR35889.1 glycine/betaine ABC transporter ATP-binding protein [Mariniplasma anaerobium]
MGVAIKVENLTVVFGTPKQKKEALKLIDEGFSPTEIKEKIGATVANKNVNFEIEEDQLFVIVGLSGSGKSTFIRTLNLLNKPTRGHIYVDGKDITLFDKNELLAYRRKDVSMIFQHFGLFSHRTVLGNVEYPLEIQKADKKTILEKSMEAIETVGLKTWEHSMPKELSGGMRQRVGLARALTNDPKLLLMDEPYSALDPLIRREMQNELLTLEDDEQRTIVFITHDMNEAFRMGDKIALMKDGEVVQIGTFTDFFKNPANDYVRDFIADVDRTRILKVRNVMRKIKNSASVNDQVDDVIKFMEDKEIEVCYVTDEKNILIGYVEKEALEKTRNKTLRALVVTEGYQIILRNSYLKDVLKDLKESDYDVPVTDSKGRLRGVLGYDDVLEALTE